MPYDDFTVFKEDLKSRIDIVDVIGEFVELKRKGTSHLGLCPFHTEKTPSFTVNRERQFYYCFGCGKGGDAPGFLMDITGMSFMEAMEQLAERVGMELPKRHAADSSRKTETDRIIAAQLAAAEYFHRTLDEDKGKPGRDYLKSRGLSHETIRAFRLGYAPEKSSDLISFARKKSVEPGALEASGIIMPSNYGKDPYNRFGGRVIFPIIDWAARIIGFGGRILEGDGAKYVNSPETLVYHKSLVLYGIHQAKNDIKRSRTAIVVEGYMDVLSMHQAGITNVIASSGTSFTKEQAFVISRMARSVILLFDGDSAGIAAAARGADNLLATDLHIGVVVLPEGHDPDSYIRENGPDAIRELLDNPVDIWEFKLRAFQKDSSDIDDITKVAGEIADSISLISDEIKRDVYITDMSLKLNIDKNTMQKAVDGRIRRRSRRRLHDESHETSPDITPVQRELFASILNIPELARHFMEEAGSRFFTNGTVKSIMDELFHRIVEGLDTSPSALMSAVDDHKAQQLIASLAVITVERDRASEIVDDNIRRFKETEITKEINEIDRQALQETDKVRKKKLINRKMKLY
ncbi:DNA primase, partial [Candidatus Omnitrophota bacterium]